MDLLKLLSKLTDENDISSETNLFDSQEARCMFNKVREGEIDVEKINKLLMTLSKTAKKQLETLTHYMKM